MPINHPLTQDYSFGHDELTVFATTFDAAILELGLGRTRSYRPLSSRKTDHRPCARRRARPHPTARGCRQGHLTASHQLRACAVYEARVTTTWKAIAPSGSFAISRHARITNALRAANRVRSGCSRIGVRSSRLCRGQVALRPLGQLCCRHAHPRHTASAKWTSTTTTAAQRKNVYCERRGRGSSPIGRRCSMPKAPNEAQGPTRPKDQKCQSPFALLRAERRAAA